ncbi:MAG: hypothetical protein KA763_11985, partial [Xanthomonadales bacterium]|nr:hypothetical protein [Xanthomonadales bacterium]
MTSPALATADDPPAHVHAEAVVTLWKQLSEQWSQDQSEQLAEHVDAWLEAADGAMVTRLGDLAAYLASFIETGRAPNTAQCIRINELIEQLGQAVPAVAQTQPDRGEPTAVESPTARDNITSIQGALAAASRQR